MESYLAVTMDGNYTTSIPTKESGKAVSSIVCDKNATGEVAPFGTAIYGSRTRQISSWIKMIFFILNQIL